MTRRCNAEHLVAVEVYFASAATFGRDPTSYYLGACREKTPLWDRQFQAANYLQAMARRYRPYERDQQLLLPPDMRECVPAGPRPVSGQIKEVRHIRRFRMPGFKAASQDSSFIALTHDVLKLFRSAIRIV